MGVKTAISIPDSLFEAAERLAQRLGLSRSELFQRAVAAYLQEHSEADVREALNRIYAVEENNAGLDQVLARLQAVSLPPGTW